VESHFGERRRLSAHDGAGISCILIGAPPESLASSGITYLAVSARPAVQHLFLGNLGKTPDQAPEPAQFAARVVKVRRFLPSRRVLWPVLSPTRPAADTPIRAGILEETLSFSHCPVFTCESLTTIPVQERKYMILNRFLRHHIFVLCQTDQGFLRLQQGFRPCHQG
jgi:hypothetical protein